MFADRTFYLNELSDERKCWNTKCPITLLMVRDRLCWHPVRCVHSQYPHVALIRAVWKEALLVTHIIVARTEPCLTTLMKHFERTETHINVTQRPRYEETLPSLSLAWLRCGYTRWFKYDRDWFVCKQAALRSSCATLREWSHNHPPSCSG